MDYTTKTTKHDLAQRLTVEIIDASGETLPLEAEFKYSPLDPFAVTAIFITGPHEVEWTFGRDLLARGLYEPTGEGDVHVRPCLSEDGHAVIMLELSSHEGQALLQIEASAVTAFVEKMSRLVHPGAEFAQVDLDSEIAAFLRSEAC
jgi:hypothetical protein